MALALVGLLLALLWLGVEESAKAIEQRSQPTVLSESQLTGARGPGCLRLVIGVDDSGSMQKISGARDQAFAQLMRWLPKNLRDDDEITVIDFARTAAVRLPTVGAHEVTSIGGVPSTVQDGRDTLLNPVLDQLATQPASGCRVALVLISDAQLADLPAAEAAGRALAARVHVDDIRLLIPGKDVDVWPQWNRAFPAAVPVRFDGRNKNKTAIALGRVIAGLTGQRFERK